MSNERLGRRQKLGVFLSVWKQKSANANTGRDNGR
jgi:hypothetical protein